MGIIKSRFKSKKKRKPTKSQIIKFPKNNVRDKYNNNINGYIVTYFIELIPINKKNIDTLKSRNKITIHQDRNTLYTSIVAVYFLNYKGREIKVSTSYNINKGTETSFYLNNNTQIYWGWCSKTLENKTHTNVTRLINNEYFLKKYVEDNISLEDIEKERSILLKNSVVIKNLLKII